MQIQTLLLTSFRNYKKEEVVFAPGLNCIEGVNGSGKSNLLEAIYLLSTGKSFRTTRLHDLIQHSKEGFSLDATFLKEGIQETLHVSLSPKGRRILHNQTSYTSFLPLLGLLPTVFLSPEDSAIIQGAPLDRRRFLDLYLAQIDPLYVHHLGRYQKAMKQRNAQLKHKQEKGIQSWEKLMALSACYLIHKRQQALLDLQAPTQHFIQTLSKQKEFFTLSYNSSLLQEKENTSPSFYEEQWQQMRKKELEIGSSLLGPHRDDILFSLDGQEVKIFGSEGQKRCCLAGLRLAQWKRLKELTGAPPLFGIDDFGVHLDEERSLLLQESLQSMGQVFLSAPSFKTLPHALYLHTRDGTLIKMKEKINDESMLVPEKILSHHYTSFPSSLQINQ